MMKNERIGYKVVVFSFDNNYESATISGIANVIYFVDKWVEPRMGNGPLAVFDTFEDAESFASHEEKIFECKYVPSEEKILWRWHGSYELFAKGDFPPGTVLADKVMLLKEVGNKNE
jgi:hypothetical protein